ncbi:MAG: trigger factor [Patescibacteria group bacterium]|nr:trigger factor [Patescibacteria group bacterium]
MSYKVTEKKSSEVAFEITVDKEKLEAVTKIVSEELGKNVKIDGFRPGKAPQFLIEKEVGKDRFWAEVIDKVVPEAYYEAVVAEKIQAIANPEIQVKEFVPGEKLVFTAKTAVLPEIKDFKYKDFKIKHRFEAPTEKEEKGALTGLTEKYAEFKEVKRAAGEGDRVEIDFKGTLKGLPFDGGESKNHPLVLGSGMMIPGFEEKIEGHKAGEEFDFEITFPKDYQAKNLAGEKVKFEVKLHKVEEKEIPELSDEFAKKFGLKDLNDLKKSLSKELAMQKELAAKRETEEKIIEKIIEKNRIEAPEVLVTEEIHRMVHEAEHNLGHSGMTLDKFLEMSQKTLEELHKEMKPEAEKRVQVGVLLGEVSKQEKIKVEDKDVDAEIEKIIATAPPELKKEDIKASYDTKERRREIANNLIIRKAVDRLWELNVEKAKK